MLIANAFVDEQPVNTEPVNSPDPKDEDPHRHFLMLGFG
jgi:hypothetical protein